MYSAPSKSTVDLRSMSHSRSSGSVSSSSSSNRTSNANRPGAPATLSGRRKLSSASSMAYLPPMNGVWLDDDDDDENKAKRIFSKKKWQHGKRSSDSSSNGTISPTKSLCTSFSVNNLKLGSEIESAALQSKYIDSAKRTGSKSARLRNLFSPSNDKYPLSVTKEMISGPSKFVHTSHIGKDNLSISTGSQTSAGTAPINTHNTETHLRQNSSSSSSFSIGSYYNTGNAMTPATSADSSPVNEEPSQQDMYGEDHRASWEDHSEPLTLNIRNPRSTVITNDQTVKKQASLDSLGWATPSVDFAEQQRWLLRHCAESETPVSEPRVNRRARPPPFETPISQTSDRAAERDVSVLLPSPLFSHHQKMINDNNNSQTTGCSDNWV